MAKIKVILHQISSIFMFGSLRTLSLSLALTLGFLNPKVPNGNLTYPETP